MHRRIEVLPPERLDLPGSDDRAGGKAHPSRSGARGGEEEIEGGEGGRRGCGGVFGRDGHGGDVNGDVAHAAGAEDFGGVADGSAGMVFVEDVRGLWVEATGDGDREGVGEDERGGGRSGRGRHAEGSRFRDGDGGRQEDAVGGGAVGEKRAGGGVRVRGVDHQRVMMGDVFEERG